MPWVTASSSNHFDLCLLSSASVIASSSGTLTLLLPSYKDPCDCIGLTQIIQDNLLILGSLI